jgi:hypothetical protein
MCGHGMDSSGSGLGQMAGYCECGNKPSGPIKCEEFRGFVWTCWLHRKDSGPLS